MHIPFLGRISAACCLTIALAARAATPSLGIFQGHQDVGTILHPGSVEYNPAQHTYTIAGSGWDMWYGEDDFHYLWTKVSGDVSLTSDITFVDKTGINHRKAVLMIRQSLDTGSASVDVALHADGLIALQFRDSAGANLHDIESSVSAPRLFLCLRHWKRWEAAGHWGVRQSLPYGAVLHRYRRLLAR
jgi:TolB protein